ncbi:MAG TPA: GNAT family N-acetyltransferase, partial [Herpetosiphonaceae bacterium]
MEASDTSELDRRTLRAFPAPAGVALRLWAEPDFPAIQQLSAAEGWPTPIDRPAESLASWRSARPALVAEAGGQLIGFARCLSDGAVTTYLAELLIAPGWRGRGVGRALLGACQALVPATRLDVL